MEKKKAKNVVIKPASSMRDSVEHTFAILSKTQEVGINYLKASPSCEFPALMASSSLPWRKPSGRGRDSGSWKLSRIPELLRPKGYRWSTYSITQVKKYIQVIKLNILNLRLKYIFLLKKVNATVFIQQVISFEQFLSNYCSD